MEFHDVTFKRLHDETPFCYYEITRFSGTHPQSLIVQVGEFLIYEHPVRTSNFIICEFNY